MPVGVVWSFSPRLKWWWLVFSPRRGESFSNQSGLFRGTDEGRRANAMNQAPENGGYVLAGAPGRVRCGPPRPVERWERVRRFQTFNQKAQGVGHLGCWRNVATVATTCRQVSRGKLKARKDDLYERKKGENQKTDRPCLTLPRARADRSTVDGFRLFDWAVQVPSYVYDCMWCFGEDIHSSHLFHESYY